MKKTAKKLFAKTPKNRIAKEAIIKAGDTAKNAKSLLSHCK